MNLHIVALFRFKENHLFDAIEILKKVTVETKKEEGCLQYDLIEDNSQKGVFFLVELWETVEHHFKHTQTSHLQEFQKNSAPILSESVLVYKGFKIF